MNRSICAIFVTYNCDEKFYSSFKSVYSRVQKVVIVDNGSRGDTIEILKELQNKYDIEVYFNQKNKGIANALNVGVQYAIDNNYDWVLTLDHDSIVTDNMIDNMVNYYMGLNIEEKKSIVSLAPTYVEEKFYMNENIDYNSKGSKEVSAVITSGNMVKTSVLKEIGLFEDKLFIDYVDFDLCFRIIKQGYKIIEVEDAILIHNLGEKKRKRFLWKIVEYSNHSYIRRYYITRNRFYVWNKYRDYAKDFIEMDRGQFIEETIKIILFENNKYLKIKMIIKGYCDFKKNKYGEISL